MKLDWVRGTKRGAAAALSAAVVLPLNNLMRHEAPGAGETLIASVFVFCVFGLIASFTDKIGFDVGES